MKDETMHEDAAVKEGEAARADAAGEMFVDGAKAETIAGASIPQEEIDRITGDIVSALKTVYDPEIPVDIYELGLIYRIDIDDDRNIAVDMTLTAPGCPVAGDMPGWVENAISTVPGVADVKVKLVFDPPWSPDRMSDEARIMLDWY